MATLYLNTPTCSGAGWGNTGVSSCYFDPKNVVGCIVVPKTLGFTAAQIADFKTTLQAAVSVVGTSSRIFPIFRFVGVVDNSEDVTVQTSGYGEKQITREGDYDWTFQYFKGGACYNTSLRRYKDGEWSVLFVDSDDQIIGTKHSDGKFYGVTTSYIYAGKWKLNDGSNVTQYGLSISLPKPEELNDRGKLAFVACDFDIEVEVKGLLDLELSEVEVAFGVATVKIKTLCGQADMYDTFPTEFADEDLWTVLDSDGAAVVIDSVTADADNKAWDLAFTATGVCTIGLASPDDLETAGIGGYPDNGYEGLTLEVTMPTS